VEGYAAGRIGLREVMFMQRRLVILLLMGAVLIIPCAILAQGAPSLTLTILHDNYVHDDAFQAEWGFACLVEGLEKTILFDTGGYQYALCTNMETSGIDVSEIDSIVLSHIHEDHIGGFACLHPLPRETSLFVPASFPTHQRGRFEVENADVAWVEEPLEICEGAMTTGEVNGVVIEQALVLQTGAGLVVITGCAHPGIVRIVETAQALFPEEPIALVLGGFHLLRSSETTLRRIAVQLVDLGVQRVAPTHCSGDLARDVFHEVFGTHYVEAGVGLVLEL